MTDQKNTRGRAFSSTSFILAVIALLGLLAYTNPTLESYETFIRQEIIEEAEEQRNPLDRMVGFFLGGFASGMIAKLTVRKDYVFLSLYDTKIGDEHLRVLGMLKNFIILEIPRSLETRH